MPINLQWTEEYRVDGGIIDSEHKKLLEIANQVLLIEYPSREAQKVRDSVLQLFQYMEYHFRREEEYAEKIHYPKIDAFKGSHRAIINRMNTMIKTCENLDDMCSQLREILASWIINHMMKVDKELGKYPPPKDDPLET